jgi:hypothetical protein
VASAAGRLGSWGVGLALGGALGGGLLACGPSFQAVYEGDVRFEHCYALDQSPASPDAKKDCWRDWLHDYTYGQSRDRVEYAGSRYSELSLDPTLPSEEKEVRKPRIVAVPAPTSAFVPPPITAEHPTADPSPAVAPSGPPKTAVTSHAPGEDCAEGCSEYWKTCKAGCKGATCETCDKAYKLCVPGCFKR